jgi:hypothetical protein
MAAYIIIFSIIIVGGFTWRYIHIRNLAERHGLDPADLFLTDTFGAEGAVERRLAETALERSAEANRQLERERSRRRKEDEQRAKEVQARMAADQARLTAAAAEVSIKPADRPREVRLHELQDLSEKGLITPDEAAARRAEILDEL